MANDKVFLILKWQNQKLPSLFYDCDCRLPFLVKTPCKENAPKIFTKQQA